MTPDAPPQDDGTTLWLVRPNVRDANRTPTWLEEGYCAIGWREVGAVEPGTTRDELRARLEHTYPAEAAATIGAWMGNLDRFVNRIAVGDRIVTPDGRRLHLGTIASGVFHVPDHDESLRREVAWEAPADRHELSPGARASLTTMLTVADLSAIAGELLA